MLLLIDNYDSFTYNVQHYFLQLGIEVVVKRNDAITVQEITALQPAYIVISPGPCSPNEAGISLDVVATFCGKIPLLGICLGHQCIVQYFGGKVIRAKQVMHGKTSKINHSQTGLFLNCPNPLEIMRYHSLLAESESLPSCLDIVATTEDDKKEIMAIQHRQLPIWGVQFHPESIKTEKGLDILQNFLQLAVNNV